MRHEKVEKGDSFPVLFPLMSQPGPRDRPQKRENAKPQRMERRVGGRVTGW